MVEILINILKTGSKKGCIEKQTPLNLDCR